MAEKTKEVEIGYIEKLTTKQQISPQLADQLKMITDSRFSNLMKSTSGPDQRDMESSMASVTSGSGLKKIRLEIRPKDGEITIPPSNSMALLGSKTQKA